MTSYPLDTDTITKLLKKHPGNQRVLGRFGKEIRRNSLSSTSKKSVPESRTGISK
jgi:hypothetical protein